MNESTGNSHLLGWLISENDMRTSAYAKDMGNEQFQLALDAVLAPYRAKMKTPFEDPFPMIFLWGVLRLGKMVFS